MWMSCQTCIITQAPLPMPQVALDNTTAELADTRKQLTTVDSERTAAAKRSSTLMTQWEERDALREEEVSKLRWGPAGTLRTSRNCDCTVQH
jgi:hypothetical protein